MKNTLKKTVCVLSTAAMLSSVLSIGASAALPVIIRKKTQTTPTASEVASTMEMLYGATYYDREAAEVKTFLRSNTYSFSMTVGEAKVLASDVAYYSEDTKIVTVDAETGALKAVAAGKTSVYVCTANGVPFLKLDITVKAAKTLAEKLSVIAGTTYLTKIGDKTTLKYTCSNKKYNDIVYDIVSGKDYAYIKDGKLVAKDYGPVVVRAYSKKYPTVCGETIIFVGKYDTPIMDGYWSSTSTGICVDKNTSTKLEEGLYTVGGWVKTEDGLMIPVVSVKKAVATRTDGSKDKTTIMTAPTYTSLEELIESICGKKPDKDDDKKPACKPGTGVRPGTGVTPEGRPEADKDDYDWIWYPVEGAKPDHKPDYKPDYKPNHKPDCKPGTGVKPETKPETDKDTSSKDEHLTDINAIRDYLASLSK